MAFPQVVADTTELTRTPIGEADVGRSVYVTAAAAWYEAMREGRGLDKWRLDTITTQLTALEALGMKGIRRTVDHADTDVAIADTTITIDLGSALPAALPPSRRPTDKGPTARFGPEPSSFGPSSLSSWMLYLRIRPASPRR